MELDSNLNFNRYVYVCEGKTDSDKLKKLGCLFVVETNGKYIKKDIINFLKRVHQKREIVLVLDPDTPGMQIKQKLINELGTCLICKANQNKAKDKNNKIGIAQMKMEDLKEILAPFVKHDLFLDENLSLDDDAFIELGLIGEGSRQKREKIIKYYDLPFTSTKKIIDALLMLSIKREDLEKVLDA